MTNPVKVLPQEKIAVVALSDSRINSWAFAGLLAGAFCFWGYFYYYYLKGALFLPVG